MTRSSASFAAALLALTLSIDEVVITFLLVGTQPILPLFMLSQTRFGFTSEINAVVTLIGEVSWTSSNGRELEKHFVAICLARHHGCRGELQESR